MSENIKIGLIAEGPTDYVIINAALSAIFKGKINYILNILQPASPDPDMLGGNLDATSTETGGGWGGVYRWCRNVVEMTGDNADGLDSIIGLDYIIIHLDADVSNEKYSNANIQTPIKDDLPIALPCPPVQNITDALKEIIKNWLAPVDASNAIWCIPAFNTETWCYAAWATENARRTNNFECNKNIRPKVWRIAHKNQRAYRNKSKDFINNWSAVKELCTQASDFEDSVCEVILKVNNKYQEDC